MTTGGRPPPSQNEIRREKRALFEQLRLNREMEQMFAEVEARRQRRAEKP